LVKSYHGEVIQAMFAEVTFRHTGTCLLIFFDEENQGRQGQALP